MEGGHTARSFHRPHHDLTAGPQAGLGLSARDRVDAKTLGPRKVPPFRRLFPAFPAGQNAAESPGRAGAMYPTRLILLAIQDRPPHGKCVTPWQLRTSFLGGKGG